jgi:hypothetical protein
VVQKYFGRRIYNGKEKMKEVKGTDNGFKSTSLYDKKEKLL